MPPLPFMILDCARRICLMAVLVLGWPLHAMAARNPCDQAADRASRATGVPVDVLRAVTRVETGRKKDGEVQPWPWAVNVSGDGYWFEDEDAALAFAFRQHKNGIRNFDVGCFQINYRWHGEAFVSIEDMFDPEANALYAAHFLSELYGEFGEWEGAAGAYHSRTKEFADRYKARFRQIRSALDTTVVADAGRSQRSPASVGSLIGALAGGRRMPGSVVAMPDARAAFIPFD